MKLHLKFPLISKPKYYDSIDDCPALIFHETMSDGNPERLLLSGNYLFCEGKRAWANIFDQYIKEFGLPESFISSLKKKVQACEMYSKAYNQGQMFWFTRARVKEKEAEIESLGEGSNFNTTCAMVSKFMGFQVDPATTSTRKFYSYIELMNNG